MSLFWKKYRITFELPTKDNKWFRYATVEFEQKRNWYWLHSYLIGTNNAALHRCVLNCIKEFFKIWINLNYMYEGEDPNRLIDEKKLEIANKKLNTLWKTDWQPSISGKIRNIEITYLIR